MTFFRRFKWFFVSGVLLLAGCSPSTERIAAVQNYCSVIQAVYVSQDLAPLAHVATQKELKKVYPVVLALKTTDNVMKTTIDSFSITGGGGDTVETREQWTFWWEDRRGGGVTKEKKTESYHLRYHLKKEKGRWKVDYIDNLND
ncbi:hypothetical protein [Geobacter pickeringii]|uniref:Lipoprotein n=1 Tax=Geobacter pickeringii TaxID=345632 RepID=A0A0B5BD57_9BACT|nr:hypothetical protein [Geobacter pickeringii]AJE04658.1 hypothetical protein GPICK_15920 [Geobacter pickeringii]